jgi:ADP-ribose pyrophosphatase YjhB (NUDIX family)
VASEVVTIHPGELPPESWQASVCVLLAGNGPSSASSMRTVTSMFRQQWNQDGRLVLFAAEGPDGSPEAERADVVMLWLAGSATPDVAALTATVQLLGPSSRRVVVGSATHRIAEAEPTLASTVTAALDAVGAGARRSGGERDIPLLIWQANSFQRWYAAQRAAGNELLGARPVWTFSIGPNGGPLLYWALQVRIFVAAEGRVKANEVVISRPDLSVMVLYKRGATLDDTIVVLVREYRSSASTADAFVHELPGGTGTEHDAMAQAIAEVREETGLAIDGSRIESHGSRQLVGTLSAHHANVFSAEISDAELDRLRGLSGIPHGADHSERTWTEIVTLRDMRGNRLSDWATIGMVAQVVLARSARSSST